MRRRLPLAVVAACLGLALSQCGAKPCDVSNCPAGCCDPNGTCRAGTGHWFCGTNGTACSTCAAGDRCNDAQVCETPVVIKLPPVDAGVDAGSGIDAGCRAVTVWPTQASLAGFVSGGLDYNYASLFTADPARPPDGGFEDLYLELYYLSSTTVPYNATFTTADTYLNCAGCLTLSTGCTAIGFCDASFFAQSGDVSVTAATKAPDAGVFQAAVSNVKLVEWDFNTDAPVPGGSCVTIGSAVWNLSWDSGSADGG